jgi:ubiquinone/menaquinone biosynthesis C-methylase UbiE
MNYAGADMSNKNAWEDEDIVEYYTRLKDLQPSEITIYNILRSGLPDMSMLDIGVGAGRTTHHFAGLVKEYIGIDYSEKMIARCRERFAEASGNISFQVCDVRSMAMFEDNRFDLVWFSFNGLDSMPHDDRLAALREIHRIGKPGGYFCFSSHNLQYINQLGMREQLNQKPAAMLKRISDWVKLSIIYNNPLQILKLMRSSHAFINDGAHEYRLKQYYITPPEQVKQLSGYFENVRIFLTDGSEVQNGHELSKINDWWVYYLCNVRK